MESTSRASICDLPSEVVISIFSYLPVADMAQCAATCKQWRGIVTEVTDLWKGKEYRSNKSPIVCAETHAVMHALPPFQKLIVEAAYGFMVKVSYPYIILSVNNIRVLNGSPGLRCKLLSTRVDIALDLLSWQSTIHFEGIRHLRIMRAWTSYSWGPRNYSADSVVCTALGLCPNLTHLAVCTDTVSGEYLDGVEGFGKLQSLEMSCPDLHKLSFLRHCSDALEELRLGCTNLPSRELTELRQLWNLRRLRLSDYGFEQGDMVAALEGLGNLESLKLNGCSLIRDLSILQRCGRLQELHITNSYVRDTLVPVMPEGVLLQLPGLRLPTGKDFRAVSVLAFALTADHLSVALARLEELGLPTSVIAYLSALRHCSQLRRLCCECNCQHAEPGLLNVRIHVILTSST